MQALSFLALLSIVGLADVKPSLSPWSRAMKSYRPWNVEQSYLFPPAPSDWLPEGHLAYFILDVVKMLDLGAITRAIDAKDARGERPHSPFMMTALLLYAYCVGVFSSRRIERATYEDVAFRVITAGHNPDFTRISEFRRTHLAAFHDVFRQTVGLCQKAGLIKLGLVALDGTKVQANASKHKAMSYERIQAEITSLLQRAEEADRADDARFGEGQRDEDLPPQLRRREDRLAKLQEAKRALEREAMETRIATLEDQAERQEHSAATHEDPVERKRAATRASASRKKAEELRGRSDDDEPPQSGGVTEQGFQTHRTPATVDGQPHPKAQYNFTDPQSRIQKRDGAYLQGYNAQVAVDGHAQVIVAQGVTNLQPDNSHLQPLLEQTRTTVGAVPDGVLGDAGYWSPENARYGEECGTNLLLATERVAHGEPPERPAPPPEDTTNAREIMRRKLATEEGRSLYARRKVIVEPVFGQIKEARGFRRFLLRGLRKVSGEWSMLTATHNLLKLYRNARPALA
jgi:transposase